MKSSKRLKLTLMILICVLIILIGFLGIYSKEGNLYKNKLPEYLLASDIKGATILEFEVDDTINTKYYDKDGKEVAAEEVTEKNEKDYKKEEIPVNNKENLTEENYEKAYNIMKERLEFLRTDQWKLDLDKKNGKIVLTYEDDFSDDIRSFLPMEGKLELVDAKTEDIILTHNDFTEAEATYAGKENKDGTKYSLFINLKLNDSGLEKINNIEKYKTQETETTETESSKTEEHDHEHEGETSASNTLKIMFDGEEVANVSYDDILLNKKVLRITTAKDLTSESTINSQFNTNTIVAKLATIGKMPVIYTIEVEEFINSEVSDQINYIIITLAALCALAIVYFIIRYKLKGLLASVGFIVNISIFLILIRLTKIQISLNGIAGTIGLIALNIVLINNILKSIEDKTRVFSENIKRAYAKTNDAFVIILIIYVVFAFSKMTVINSMGLLVFWGWLVTVIGNLIFTVPMLAISKKE